MEGMQNANRELVRIEPPLKIDKTILGRVAHPEGILKLDRTVGHISVDPSAINNIVRFVFEFEDVIKNSPLNIVLVMLNLMITVSRRNNFFKRNFSLNIYWKSR